MSKRKPVYFIEIRKRIKNGSENECLRNNFGGFSSVEKAQLFLKKEGRQIIKDFARGYKHKDLFFAVLEMQIDRIGWEMPMAEIAFDLDGNRTVWFRNLK